MIQLKFIFNHELWRREEKGTTEDEMVGWHHQCDGHEFQQTAGVGDGQGGLACCSPWGHKESDTTEWLNRTERWRRHGWASMDEEAEHRGSFRQRNYPVRFYNDGYMIIHLSKPTEWTTWRVNLTLNNGLGVIMIFHNEVSSLIL